jgi:hypothetical protein
MNRTRGNEAARTPAIVEDSSLAPPCPQQVATSASLDPATFDPLDEVDMRGVEPSDN